MFRHVTQPVVLFWIVASGLLAYVLARMLSGAVLLPRTAIVVLGVGALATGVLSALSLRQAGDTMRAILRFVVLIGAVAFGVVFGLTWLFSA